jgi:hypothetical protein
MMRISVSGAALLSCVVECCAVLLISLIYLLTHALTHSLTHSLTHYCLLVDSSQRPCCRQTHEQERADVARSGEQSHAPPAQPARGREHQLGQGDLRYEELPLTHSLTEESVHSIFYSLTYLLTYSLTHSLTHSFCVFILQYVTLLFCGIRYLIPHIPISYHCSWIR